MDLWSIPLGVHMWSICFQEGIADHIPMTSMRSPSSMNFGIILANSSYTPTILPPCRTIFPSFPTIFLSFRTIFPSFPTIFPYFLVAGFFPARLTPERRIVHGGESCLATSMTTAVRTAGIRTVRLERLEWLEDLGISYAIYIYYILYDILVYILWLVAWNMFYDFPYIGNNNLNWLIFFGRVETTNQIHQPDIYWLVWNVIIPTDEVHDFSEQ